MRDMEKFQNSSLKKDKVTYKYQKSMTLDLTIVESN